MSNDSITLDESKKVIDNLYEVTFKSFLCSQQSLVFLKKKPVLSIILVLYKKPHLTLACLRSLLENSHIAFELVIVDNASGDLTAQLLDRIQGALLIRNTENKGFLRACNDAAQHCCGKYILFLNNDTVVLPGALQNALNTLENDIDVGAVGAKIIHFDGKLQEAGNQVARDGTCRSYGRGQDPFDSKYLFEKEVDYCSGAFLMTPRELFLKQGGFDEIYSPAYYEETDYCFRLKELGKKVIYNPACSLFHYEFASTEKSTQPFEWMRKNQKIFAQRFSKLLNERESLSETVTRKKRILYIEDRVPYPHLGAGFPRAHQILKKMVELGYSVTFFPTLVFNDKPWEIYNNIPNNVEFILGYGQARLLQFLKQRANEYDLFFVSRPHNMKLIPLKFRLKNSQKMIYDAEAVFTLRDYAFFQLTEYRTSSMPLSAHPKFQKKLKKELFLAKHSRMVLSVSEEEKKHFETITANVVHLGHCVPFAEFSSLDQLPPFSKRKGILFVGSIHYHRSPNSDSVIWFSEEIFPRIKKYFIQKGEECPKFLIAGLNRSPEVSSLQQNQKDIEVLGMIPDLKELYQSCRIFVAPTRFAAGIPQKIHSAAAHGIPIVATELLVKQLGWLHSKELLSAPVLAPESFAKQCIELYENQGLWEKIQKNALERIKKDCSEEQFKKVLSYVLESAL